MNENIPMQEFETFSFTTSKNEKMELAIVDSFLLEEEKFLLAARVEGDIVHDEEGVFLFQEIIEEDQAVVVRIEDKEKYAKVAQAYLAMQNTKEEEE